MKLWCVENGYLGNGNVHVLVVADSEERAKELASESFKREAEKMGTRRGWRADAGYVDEPFYTDDYWEVSELRAELVFDDLTREAATKPDD